MRDLRVHEQLVDPQMLERGAFPSAHEDGCEKVAVLETGVFREVELTCKNVAEEGK
jgi:hypothetical protein